MFHFGVMALRLKNPHPRDARVHFIEDTHKYYIDGSSEDYISVTTLIHSLFPHFDADQVIKKMRRGRNWKSSKYFGMTDEEIKKSWDDNRDSAATSGTAMHAGIEAFYNDDAHEIASTREFNLFTRFRDEFPDMEIFRTEFVLFAEDAKVAGSVDALYVDPDKPDHLIMVDWKRSKEIKKSNKYQKGTSPITAHLDDCNHIHYSLQLHTYSYILEKYYGYKISRKFLVVLHPNQEDFEKVDALNLRKEAAEIIEMRRALFSNSQCA